MKNTIPFFYTSFRIPALDTALKPPKLLDQLKRCIRDKHYSPRTEEVYVYWARWFIRFHDMRHPAEMGAPEVQAFLSYLSNERHVAVATHKQALCTLLFLFRQVLQLELPWMEELHRPTRPHLSRQTIYRTAAMNNLRNRLLALHAGQILITATDCREPCN